MNRRGRQAWATIAFGKQGSHGHKDIRSELHVHITHDSLKCSATVIPRSVGFGGVE